MDQWGSGHLGKDGLYVRYQRPQKKWWEKVTIIVWGAPDVLATENAAIQVKIKEALKAGVYITACKACADQLGLSEQLTELGIKVQYTGQLLTDILKNDAKLLTV